MVARPYRRFGSCAAAAAWALLAAAPAAAADAATQAHLELERTRALVDAGALPRQALEQARDTVEEARLRETIQSTLRSDDLSPDEASALLRAATLLRDRARARFDRQSRLAGAGALPRLRLREEKQRLDIAEQQYHLAAAKARFVDAMATMARAEERWRELEEENLAFAYFGEAEAWEEDLFLLEAAFEQEFGQPLPVSADGETRLHRSLGFDHTARVDVALHPDEERGRFVTELLESWGVPYLAFRSAVPGSSTGPHIHIGLPSPRTVAATSEPLE